jgi:hypothetical protein
VGTTLFHYTLRKLAEPLKLRLAALFGMVHKIDPAIDLVLVGHSLPGFEPARPFRAIRVVRDPRDVWLSSYLYHRRTDEAWCTSTDFDPTAPITWPRVDLSFQHRPERWKREWLARLDGKSYQQNLLVRDQDAGLQFELEGYTACTLDAMRGWRLLGPEVLQVKLEDVMANFDTCMLAIFRHLGFTAAECDTAVQIAATEDVNRMDDAALAANTHIHSRTISKWRNVLSPSQVAAFERRYGDLIRGLGYDIRPAGTAADFLQR